MNWFARLFPKWHVTERNLAREFEKILSQKPAMTYGQVQAAVEDVANAFGIVDGSFYITWFSVPRTRERNKEREAGLICAKIRLVTFRHRIRKAEAVMTMELERNWYAPVSRKLILASELTYVPDSFSAGPYWQMKPIADTQDENFQTTLEELK
jgi:hypothetical protein